MPGALILMLVEVPVVCTPSMAGASIFSPVPSAMPAIDRVNLSQAPPVVSAGIGLTVSIAAAMIMVLDIGSAPSLAPVTPCIVVPVTCGKAPSILSAHSCGVKVALSKMPFI
ncbi:Uncharacterised protein [Mycobacteroides abscessus subsp. massiliense]|nr:Uncharacterised protein [Mycobacteroides abscessus subsp. abscessus]SKX75548.1 Uncharacterised protein [Mycobacteroides abscessus subsp. massiliense]